MSGTRCVYQCNNTTAVVLAHLQAAFKLAHVKLQNNTNSPVLSHVHTTLVLAHVYSTGCCTYANNTEHAHVSNNVTLWALVSAHVQTALELACV